MTNDRLWYYSNSDDLWVGECATRDEIIKEGRAYYGAGVDFSIAQGCYIKSWPILFSTEADLARYIDDENEDNAFEDGFCEEAGITPTILKPLLININKLWAEFVEEINPVSRLLDLENVEIIGDVKHD